MKKGIIAMAMALLGMVGCVKQPAGEDLTARTTAYYVTMVDSLSENKIPPQRETLLEMVDFCIMQIDSLDEVSKFLYAFGPDICLADKYQQWMRYGMEWPGVQRIAHYVIDNHDRIKYRDFKRFHDAACRIADVSERSDKIWEDIEEINGRK
jgi:hypothetical protein